MSSTPFALCFGEVLWDCAPKGLFLGGAPMNAAYHLNKLGLYTLTCSAVGEDFLGEEIVRRIVAWGMSPDLISTVPAKPTGVVQVDLTNPGDPHYTIVDDVAWDYIAESPSLFHHAHSASVLIYGSLALRHSHNRALLEKMLARATGLKVFDVNLRPPYFDSGFVRELAGMSDLVKTNVSELEILHPVAVGDLEVMASSFSQLLGGPSVCVTNGKAGAGLWMDRRWHWAGARPVAVSGDSVGAGDAFLAGLLDGIISGISPDKALARACRVAEFVASKDGAQPDYDGSALSVS